MSTLIATARRPSSRIWSERNARDQVRRTGSDRRFRPFRRLPGVEGGVVPDPGRRKPGGRPRRPQLHLEPRPRGPARDPKAPHVIGTWAQADQRPGPYPRDLPLFRFRAGLRDRAEPPRLSAIANLLPPRL